MTFTVRLGGCRQHLVSLHSSGSISPPAPGVSELPVQTRCSQRALHPSSVPTIPQLCLINYGFVPATNPKRPQETCRKGPGVPPLPFRLLLSRGCCTVAHRRAETLAVKSMWREKLTAELLLSSCTSIVSLIKCLSEPSRGCVLFWLLLNGLVPQFWTELIITALGQNVYLSPLCP